MSSAMLSIAKLMNAKALLERIIGEITLPESREEKQSIALFVMEKLYGLDLTRVLTTEYVHDVQESTLDAIVQRINRHEPLQYIFQEAHFFGMTFSVTPAVLIPRPETEQLIELVMAETGNKQGVTLLDVGTGSGCIAISLAKSLSNAQVYALDVSDAALAIARKNADALQATVLFDKYDVLLDKLPYRNLSAIVSNPPYVMRSEMQKMDANVVAYEPHLALFVPDDDALIFYKGIANQAKTILAPDGKIFVEINEQLGLTVCEVFRSAGFSKTKIVKDIFKKERIVTASQGVI
jgi:release factor glutamine methyltransferase